MLETVAIPPELTLWEASLLGCGVVTGVGAVRNAARVAVGESVCVVGCGGIGLQIVAAARLVGAPAWPAAPNLVVRARPSGRRVLDPPRQPGAGHQDARRPRRGGLPADAAAPARVSDLGPSVSYVRNQNELAFLAFSL